MLEDAFLKAMTGKALHRFSDCKRVLRTTEIDVLSYLVAWRKKAHFCHANALSQSWFLSPEWGQIKNVKVALEAQGGQHKSMLSAQLCVTEVCTKMVLHSEITGKSDIPKLLRCMVNIDIFKELAGVISPALQYFQNLEQKYLGVWHQLTAGKKLASRLLVDRR